MRTFTPTRIAAFALFFGLGCGGATAGVPSSSGGDGTNPGDPGTGPSPTPTPTQVPTSSPTMMPTRPPPCAECLSTTVSWGDSGGLTQFHDSSSVSSCRNYVRSRSADTGTPVVKCTTNLAACSASAIGVGDVEAALADPDVIAALDGKTKTYGRDDRPCDGSVVEITVGTKTVEVGGECSTTGGCTQGPCVEVPKGLRALTDLLDKLDVQAASADPSCTGN